MRASPLVLLLLLAACVPKAKYDAVVARNEELRGRVERLEGRLERTRATYEAILADLKPLVDRGVLKVENRDGRVVIGMASDVLFPSGSAALSDEGRRNVAEVARLLTRHAREHHFQVEGHTDDVPIATPEFPSNWYLGAARAITVADVMVAQGFPRGQLSAASFADTEPVADNGSPAGRAANRRIEIVLLPELGDLPHDRAGNKPPRTPPPRPPRR